MSSASSFRVGLVQHRAGRDVDQNIEEVCALIRQGAAAGAGFVLTPEMTHLFETSGERLQAATALQDFDRGVERFSRLARELSLWLNIGSLAIQIGDGRFANRSFLFAPDGGLAASYDKIHMFDVQLGGGERYRESESYRAGRRAVTASLPWGMLGMTICYDVRFPGLYRNLAQAGADFLTIPAAFTLPTGKAHWHTLLRSRAIENGCYVFAPAQEGEHECGRKTYGHSLIVSPWGKIMGEAQPGPGIVLADIDPGEVETARARIPSLSIEQSYDLPVPGLQTRR